MMPASHLRCEAARSSENSLAYDHDNSRHFQNQKAQVVWPCSPKTCRELRGPCVPSRLFKSETTSPTAKAMVHPNPRGHRPTAGDSRTQSVRKARQAERSHGETEDPERITTISQVKFLNVYKSIRIFYRKPSLYIGAPLYIYRGAPIYTDVRDLVLNQAPAFDH